MSSFKIALSCIFITKTLAVIYSSQVPTCNFDLILLQMWGFAAWPCDRSSFLNLPFSVLLGEDSGVSLPQIIESVAEVAVALGRWAPSGVQGRDTILVSWGWC